MAETNKGNCFINDTMASILVIAARENPNLPASSLLDRLHRADADGLFDGKVWGNMSSTDWRQLQLRFMQDYL